MPKIFTCHLTSLATTYNATSNIFHADGAPLETDMALSFQEIKALTRQDLYNEDGDTKKDGRFAGSEEKENKFDGSLIVKNPKAATATTGD